MTNKKANVQRLLQMGLVGWLFATGLVANASAATDNKVLLASPGDREAAIAKDPLLVAMREELNRERELLVLPGMQRPYFMEYRVDDFQTFDAVANYGALTRDERNHQRIVRVVIRIGDYTSDSSSPSGEGSVDLAPEDNNPASLKYALWTATDEAYKAALRAFATSRPR